MSFGFPPKGWALCNGQLLPINQNQGLFALLGTIYGGDGRTNFALPNLRGRTPVAAGDGLAQGQHGGVASHALTSAELPAHAHVAQGSASQADSGQPGRSYLGAADGVYAGAANLTPLHPTSISDAGGGRPHENMQPYLTLSFCIALQGEFPPRS